MFFILTKVSIFLLSKTNGDAFCQQRTQRKEEENTVKHDGYIGRLGLALVSKVLAPKLFNFWKEISAGITHTKNSIRFSLFLLLDTLNMMQSWSELQQTP